MNKTLKNKDGVALIVVLCVMALFLALISALLYGASAFSAASVNRLDNERCYQLAKSFSDSIATELTDPTKESGVLQTFCQDFCDDTAYAPDTAYYFDGVPGGTDVEENYGKVTLVMTKHATPPEDLGQNITYSGSTWRPATEAFIASPAVDYTLTITVLDESEKDSFRYSLVYRRLVTCPALFSYSGGEIYYKNGVWYSDEACTVKAGITSGTVITATYDIEHATAYAFGKGATG